MPELYREFGVGKCRAFLRRVSCVGAPGPVGRVRGHAACGLEPNSGSPPRLPPLESGRGTRRAHARGPTGPGSPNVAGRAERRTYVIDGASCGSGESPSADAADAFGRWPLYARGWEWFPLSSPFRSVVASLVERSTMQGTRASPPATVPEARDYRAGFAGHGLRLGDPGGCGDSAFAAIRHPRPTERRLGRHCHLGPEEAQPIEPLRKADPTGYNHDRARLLWRPRSS